MIRIFSALALMLLVSTPSVSRPGGFAQDAEGEGEPLAGSGQPVWAEGYEGELILGLDGNLYEAYHPATVEHIQRVLRNRGLYAGPLNGVLDRPTMDAIYIFQEANYELQICGVPTPRTRRLLEQGSHTS